MTDGEISAVSFLRRSGIRRGEAGGGGERRLSERERARERL